MRELASVMQAIGTLRQPAALATLVRVTGSSYRKPGARLVFGADGLRQGLISAGCLEEDVLERLQSVLDADQPQVVTYNMGSDLDLLWGTGMGCEGTVEVLLERVLPGELPAWMPQAADLLERRVRAVVATVFAVRGRGPTVGSGLVVDAAWDRPPIPADFAPGLRTAASEVLERGQPVSTTVVGEAGEADVLLVPLLPPIALWIYGAGEPARPLARMAKELGWFVGIADHRPALATRERFPGADKFAVGAPATTLPDLPWDARSAVLVLSHVYERDAEALEALQSVSWGYLGLQGNRKRCAKLLALLPESTRRLVHAPAGLDLGAETPEAIGLSMLAEIQMTLAGRPGGSLRDREGPIHI